MKISRKQLLITLVVIVVLFTGLYIHNRFKRPAKTAAKPAVVCGQPLTSNP